MNDRSQKERDVCSLITSDDDEETDSDLEIIEAEDFRRAVFRDEDRVRREEAKGDETDGDIEIVGTVGGLVANRDLPHQRMDCAEHPFTLGVAESNSKACAQCYCYVCDVSAAQCEFWGTGLAAHHHANARQLASWKRLREDWRAGRQGRVRSAFRKPEAAAAAAAAAAASAPQEPQPHANDAGESVREFRRSVRVAARTARGGAGGSGSDVSAAGGMGVVCPGLGDGSSGNGNGGACEQAAGATAGNGAAAAGRVRGPDAEDTDPRPLPPRAAGVVLSTADPLPFDAGQPLGPDSFRNASAAPVHPAAVPPSVVAAPPPAAAAPAVASAPAPAAAAPAVASAPAAAAPAVGPGPPATAAKAGQPRTAAPAGCPYVAVRGIPAQSATRADGEAASGRSPLRPFGGLQQRQRAQAEQASGSSAHPGPAATAAPAPSNVIGVVRPPAPSRAPPSPVPPQQALLKPSQPQQQQPQPQRVQQPRAQSALGVAISTQPRPLGQMHEAQGGDGGRGHGIQQMGIPSSGHAHGEQPLRQLPEKPVKPQSGLLSHLPPEQRSLQCADSVSPPAHQLLELHVQVSIGLERARVSVARSEGPGLQLQPAAHAEGGTGAPLPSPPLTESQEQPVGHSEPAPVPPRRRVHCRRHGAVLEAGAEGREIVQGGKTRQAQGTAAPPRPFPPPPPPSTEALDLGARGSDCESNLTVEAASRQARLVGALLPPAQPTEVAAGRSGNVVQAKKHGREDDGQQQGHGPEQDSGQGDASTEPGAAACPGERGPAAKRVCVRGQGWLGGWSLGLGPWLGSGAGLLLAVGTACCALRAAGVGL